MVSLVRAIAGGVLLIAGFGTAPATTASPAVRLVALPAVAVVPQPRDVRVVDAAFAWPARVRIQAATNAERTVAERFQTYLHDNGVTATLAGSGRGCCEIILHIGREGDRLGAEGYALAVSASQIVVVAARPNGAYYALQTLEQISAPSGGVLRSRAVTILDRPAYAWRGIQLDVARHFFAVPTIERYIDVAAHYKLNVFHWHLTDDQAWRLESRRYPLLTAGGPHYTRADVRRIVAYAKRRFVTVVPEIDLPGHAGAVTRAYPQLACAHQTLCTNDAGATFARNVLGEVMADFPSPYVHAGGDEVAAPALADQPRFTRELERFIESRGRTFAGWDDVLTGQLSPRALVTVWTSPQRATAAAARGNAVVIATGPLHFDSVQGDAAQEPRGAPHMATLEQVYDAAVIPPGLRATAWRRVLGAQADVWTEHIATPERLFSMTLPRELALAENVWTPRPRKSWDGFVARLPAQLAWLDAHGYAFRIPNAAFSVRGGRTAFTAVPGHVQAVRAWTDAPAVTVALRVPLEGAVIRYTTDGTAPGATSPAYRGPFVLQATQAPIVLRAAAFFRGRAGTMTECSVARVATGAVRARRGATSWSALVSP